MKVLHVRENGIAELCDVQSPGELLPGLWITETPFIDKRISVATSADVDSKNANINVAVTFRRIYGPVVFTELIEGTRRHYTDISGETIDKILNRFPKIILKKEQKKCIKTSASLWGRLMKRLKYAFPVKK